MGGILGAVSDAAPVLVGAGGVGAVLVFGGVLVRQVVQQQAGWQVLAAADRTRARVCEEALATAQAAAREAAARASKAEVLATAAAATAATQDIQLDELRLQLAECRGRLAVLEGDPGG